MCVKERELEGEDRAHTWVRCSKFSGVSCSTTLCDLTLDENDLVWKATFEDGTQGTALPTVDIAKADLAAGIPAFEAMVKAGLANSNGEARRLIRGGGGRVNDVVISDESQTISTADINADGAIKFSAGKKRHVLAKPV